ncbi:hypothetical protein HMPREF3181_00907 [Parvimonas sp. KA00067]|uniref:hypothetical protein n=1 Tax=Parvimonas sp. KA00067 TaxID=1588755 RepID=UPI00079AA777|nr:hypothetical protein [Parvimonas sp. KA00067]KXB66162.1 hypothetical protein HMPREF3181_00907 [Parvimonas sp. KA00067]
MKLIDIIFLFLGGIALGMASGFILEKIYWDIHFKKQEKIRRKEIERKHLIIDIANEVERRIVNDKKES